LQVVEELVGYLQAARMLAAAAKRKQPPTAELAALAADGAAAQAEQEMDIDGAAHLSSQHLHQNDILVCRATLGAGCSRNPALWTSVL
jgi:hypothetical protein